MEDVLNNAGAADQGANNTDVTTGAAGQETPKVFTQEEVDKIVKQRISRERERINGMVNDDETIRQELMASKLKLSASKELSEAGLPLDLADFVDYTNEESSRASLDTLKKVYDKAFKAGIASIYKENGRSLTNSYSPIGGRTYAPNSMRSAMGLK